MREATKSVRRATSSRSSLTSEECAEVVMADTEGAETSMTLSAMSASLLMSMVESVEARTILTLAGSRWRNNSWKKEAASADALSLSPRSCCIRRKSCVGFRSPSSLPLSCPSGPTSGSPSPPALLADPLPLWPY